MTIASALTYSAYQQAFLKLDLSTRMWIDMKAQGYVALGRFGASELSAFKQQVVAKFGAAAATGSPSLLQVACWYVAMKVAQASATSGGLTQVGSLSVQSASQQQTMQTLSSVSSTMHSTSMSIIQNLR